MQKIFTLLLVLVVVAWGGIVPAHAAPMAQDPGPIIECVTLPCTQISDTTVRIENVEDNPYYFRINEDVPGVYYLITPNIEYWHTSPWSTSAKYRYNYPGTGQVDGNTISGIAKNEHVIFSEPLSLYVANALYHDNDYFIDVFPVESPDVMQSDTALGGSYIYVSVDPINLCDEEFITLTEDTFEIDPTIETPLGPEGTPADDQIYTTVIDQYYQLYVTGGPWNDGTEDKTDVAISWDAVTWTPLPEPTCQMQMEDGQVVDTYIFIAESETFYIRVNDTEGDFADNTNNPDPMEYTISIGVYSEEATCESQFAYGEGDWVASVSVHADVNGVLATSDLEVGEWYAVKVASGTWQDEGSPPDRTDMEYIALADITQPLTYTDLAGGSDGVWCQTTDGYTTFIQADGASLYLRVNNEVGSFSSNTGTLGVNIYHAAFTRAEQTCETVYERGELISSGVVNANQSNGKAFAYSVGSATLDMSVGLEPGAWYYLETVGGPWTIKDGEDPISYDMAISEDGDTWVSFPDWERGECNIALDALGHRGVFFQIPESAAVEWFLRVDDLTTWFNNRGSMEWNLYGVSRMNVELSPGQACDFAWSDDKHSGGWVDATSDGENMYLYPQGMETQSYYALVILGNDYYWQEETGGDPMYGMQVSNDGGDTWNAFPDDYAGSLCTITSGHQTVTFIKVVKGQDWMIRVDSASFANNLLGMGYEIYAATPGNTLDPWTSCFEDASLFPINSLTYIPVKEEPGIYINGTNILAGGNEIQLLQPTETYKLEINEGPWSNGEGTNSYSAAVSSDNGATWYAIDDQTNPDIICGDTDFTGMHRSIYFTVQEGQKWKIRVNDTEGDFLNNSGNLAYTLYSAYGDEDIPPVDVTVLPSVVNNVCVAPLVRPSSILEVSAWVNYARQGIQKYFAWCPDHTDILVALFNGLKTVEPFATIAEMGTALQSMKAEMTSYEWTSEGEDFSILDKSPTESFEMFTDHAYAPIASDNPWESGVVDVNSFEDFEMPSSYSACQEYLSPQAGSKLAQGVCYASSLFLLTGASFWIQLILDVGIGILCIKSFSNTVGAAIAMATGVARSQTVDVQVNNAYDAAGLNRGRFRR